MFRIVASIGPAGGLTQIPLRRRIAALTIMVARQDDEAVWVTWPKDRERYRPALVELPLFRFLRRGMAVSLVVSAILLAVMLWLRPDVATVGVAVVPGLLGVTCYLSTLRSTLRGVGTGTLSWRMGSQGLRIEGEVVTEIPWSHMARWRRAAGHVIIEMKRPGGGASAPPSPRP